MVPNFFTALPGFADLQLLLFVCCFFFGFATSRSSFNWAWSRRFYFLLTRLGNSIAPTAGTCACGDRKSSNHWPRLGHAGNATAPYKAAKPALTRLHRVLVLFCFFCCRVSEISQAISVSPVSFCWPYKARNWLARPCYRVLPSLSAWIAPQTESVASHISYLLLLDSS